MKNIFQSLLLLSIFASSANLYAQQWDKDGNYIKGSYLKSQGIDPSWATPLDPKVEENRLNRICPTYASARQSCKSAGNYVTCMTISVGKKYSLDTDQTCFNR